MEYRNRLPHSTEHNRHLVLGVKCIFRATKTFSALLVIREAPLPKNFLRHEKCQRFDAQNQMRIGFSVDYGNLRANGVTFLDVFLRFVTFIIANRLLLVTIACYYAPSMDDKQTQSDSSLPRVSVAGGPWSDAAIPVVGDAACLCGGCAGPTAPASLPWSVIVARRAALSIWRRGVRRWSGGAWLTPERGAT